MFYLKHLTFGIKCDIINKQTYFRRWIQWQTATVAGQTGDHGEILSQVLQGRLPLHLTFCAHSIPVSVWPRADTDFLCPFVPHVR